MGKPYSMDLRERAVAAVLRDGLSRHESAARFGVAPSTVINWVRRVSGNGERRAWPDGRAKAQGDCWRARYVSVAARPGRRLHLGRTGGRTG